MNEWMNSKKINIITTELKNKYKYIIHNPTKKEPALLAHQQENNVNNILSNNPPTILTNNKPLQLRHRAWQLPNNLSINPKTHQNNLE